LILQTHFHITLSSQLVLIIMCHAERDRHTYWYRPFDWVTLTATDHLIG